MAFVVIDNCDKCKFTDCVEVCPVECFYEVGSQLVINPDECIDCGACEPECPVEAIYDETELPDSKMDALEFNRMNSENNHNNVIEMKEPLPTAEARKKELGY